MKLKFWGNEHMCQKSRKLGGRGEGGGGSCIPGMSFLQKVTLNTFDYIAEN